MKPVMTYMGAHKRVYRIRGRAFEYLCFECSEPAQQWAYDHDDPNAQHGPVKGPGSAICEFSSDPWHYVPLCVRCHCHWDGRVLNASRGGSISKRTTPQWRLDQVVETMHLKAPVASQVMGISINHVYRLRKRLAMGEHQLVS